MRRLLFIRHAKSSWKHPHLDDHERPLNKRGQGDVLVMAQRLVNANEKLDAIISSTAVRAMGIAKPIADALNIPLIENHKLYTFSNEELLNTIKDFPVAMERIALVGHNPAITECVNVLGNMKIDNVPTSGMVSFDCDIAHWAELKPNYCRFVGFDYPKKLKSEE